ncbi:MAG: hypothetical protein E7370_05140 [Clostridiales bacterium]|nr:hypothetical protein [Clostridiales bacterium]
MKDFKSYEPKQPNDKANSVNSTQVNNTVNLAKAVAEAFSGKTETDVLRTILAQAEEGKRNGTLTNADLDNFYATVSPMLDGFKRQKLKQIIAKLKAI